MVGPDAYVKGDRIEFGINGVGAFEGASTSTSPAPAGMHGRSSTGYFGIVANPQRNSWSGSAFDGDFFTPGSPENGWGIEIGTGSATSKGNNCTGLQQINGAITSWSHTGGYYSVNWEGNVTSVTDLHLKINYLLQDTALFYTTTISITNNTTATIPDMYYYRNMDPDNNEEIGAGFTTTNKIISEPTGPGTYAQVCATQSAPWNSYISFIGAGSNWKADYGGFSNRNASDLWIGGITTSGTFIQTADSSNVADEAISIACRIQNLNPGATETIQYMTVVDTLSVDAALSSILFLNFPGEDNGSSFIPDTVKICGADSVPINVSGPTSNNYNWAWSPSAGLSDSTGILVMTHPLLQTTYTVIGTPISGTGTNDTMLIIVKPYAFSLVATFSSLGIVCGNLNPFVLSGGSPLGGIYNGIGVSNDSIFDPGSLNGSYLLSYTVSDSNACSATATATVYVDSVGVSFPNPVLTVCDNAPAFLLTGGNPLGGIYSGPGVVDDTVFNPAVTGVGTYYIYYTVSDSNSCFGIDSAGFVVDNCAGITTNYLNNNLSVYPNPFTNEATITVGADVQLKNAKIYLYDILGKEVFHAEGIHDHEFKIERKNLENGIYFYRFVNDETIISSGKIVIQ
ncbi:MAG: T9SS type A sorting domain-containing protein [Bacteroidia bacterium]